MAKTGGDALVPRRTVGVAAVVKYESVEDQAWGGGYGDG